jgi:uncharacterized RDD family membrane protein YckC
MTAAELAGPAVPPAFRGRYAGFVSRMAAGGVDIVVCAVASTGLIFFVQALTAVMNAEPVGDATVNSDLVSVLIALLILAYFTGSWAITGRTAGEALFGLRVIRPNGKRVHLIRAFVRCVMGIFSFGFFFIGYLWILFDRRRRGWQDIVARTVVVYDWDDGAP